MKIVHLIDYYQPRVGYQEYFLAREHARLGIQTYIVTSDRYFPFPDYENSYKGILGQRIVGTGVKKEDGISVFRLKSWEIPHSNLIYLKNLKHIIYKIKPDLIICHGVYSITSFLIARYKKNFGFKLIFDNHAAIFNTDFNRSILRKLYHVLFKNVFADTIKKNADNIFAIGEAEQDFICRDLKLNKKAVPIIRLGVDSKLFQYSKKAREIIRSKHKIGSSNTVFIFTGKITPNKDVHILVQALEKLQKTVLLLLIGGGPDDYLKQLKKIALNTRIIHIPFVENSKLPEYYSASDIAVWPGDSTISILEAMSSSLPVILPHWHGNDFLNKSRGIIRFIRGNSADLLQKIKNLTYNTSKQNIGKLNRQYVEKNLDWKKISIKIYEQKILER